MSPATTRPSAARSERGFTMIEMLVATVIMMAVTGTIFSLMNPAQGVFQAQPEVSDMQQRLRVGVDALSKDLVMAGAGSYQGSSTGSLINLLAPVMPYRAGGSGDDPAGNVFYRSDAISVLYVPPGAGYSTIKTDIPAGTVDLDVTLDSTCPDKLPADQPCGFKKVDHMGVLVFDKLGNADAFTVTSVPSATSVHLHRDGPPSAVLYQTDAAMITQASFHTYYLKTDVPTATYQLMHFDGKQTDSPIVDNVVKLSFEYFGDSFPPQLLNIPLSDPKGPWTTYGPKPPALGQPNGTNTWPASENCVFKLDAAGLTQVPRLDTLDATATQVKLDPAIFKDGPWCPDDTRAERFDADLLRVRRIRVTLRVQTGSISMRGPAGTLFVRGGLSTSTERYVPDQEIRFDVTPRNMNLGR